MMALPCVGEKLLLPLKDNSFPLGVSIDGLQHRLWSKWTRCESPEYNFVSATFVKNDLGIISGQSYPTCDIVLGLTLHDIVRFLY